MNYDRYLEYIYNWLINNSIAEKLDYLAKFFGYNKGWGKDFFQIMEEYAPYIKIVPALIVFFGMMYVGMKYVNVRVRMYG